jgi:hypothetical protein
MEDIDSATLADAKNFSIIIMYRVLSVTGDVDYNFAKEVAHNTLVILNLVL